MNIKVKYLYSLSGIDNAGSLIRWDDCHGGIQTIWGSDKDSIQIISNFRSCVNVETESFTSYRWRFSRFKSERNEYKD